MKIRYGGCTCRFLKVDWSRGDHAVCHVRDCSICEAEVLLKHYPVNTKMCVEFLAIKPLPNPIELTTAAWGKLTSSNYFYAF